MRRCIFICAAMTVLIAAASLQCALAVELRNPGFDEGNAGQYNHWWSPWDWYTFTICPPDQSDPPLPDEYIWRDWANGPVDLPTVNGFPQWIYMGGWNPMVGIMTGRMEYGMTPYCDFSNGYDKPVNVGRQWIKKNPGNPYYSGIAQYAGCLEVGKTYEVSAWGVSSCENTPADMRILIDPYGGNDARTAPISSPPVPNRPLGRYWMWSSLGNHRIGNYVEVRDNPLGDITGAYSIYDKVSVQFTAVHHTATIFLLTDSTPWVPGEGDGEGLGIGWDNVEIREVHAPVSTIGDAKKVPTGTPVTLTGAVVTAVFANGIYQDLKDPCFFVQDSDRAAGIVVLGAREVERGDIVNIEGVVARYNGQAAVKPGPVTVTGSVSTETEPIAMTNAAAGGVGVKGGTGLDSLGLLVKVWGKVTSADFATSPTGSGYYYFTLDDGSGVSGGYIPQVVQNPDFESFNPGYFALNWTSTKDEAANSGPVMLWSCNGGMGPRSGRAFIGRLGGAGRGWAYQIISGLTPGVPATVKAFGWSGGDSGARVRVGVDPAVGSSPVAPTIVWGPSTYTDGMWQELSLNFVPCSTMATLYLEFDHSAASGNARTGFEDVNVYTASLEKKGIKVSSMDIMPNVGETWAVTGVLSSELDKGEQEPVRLLLPRDYADGEMQ